MNVEWLMEQLRQADPHDEVIVTVEDIGTGEALGGILSHVIASGSGARLGQFEIHAKG